VTGPAEQAPAAEQFGLATALVVEETLEAAMQRLTSSVVTAVQGAEAAGLTVPAGGRFTTVAATESLPLQVDPLQYAYGGPCVDALTGTAPMTHTDDLSKERRWDRLAAAAVDQTEVRSIASYRLALPGDRPIASLNLYARRPRAFTPAALRSAEQLAAEATLALAMLRERQARVALERALDSNRTIGVATGILMSSLRLSREDAFALLQGTSQRLNRKLRTLSQDVVVTRTLPG
jgi:ANTAR domain-containing protein/GAF domain-containing protein